jgi:HEAT repeat protein
MKRFTLATIVAITAVHVAGAQEPARPAPAPTPAAVPAPVRPSRPAIAPMAPGNFPMRDLDFDIDIEAAREQALAATRETRAAIVEQVRDLDFLNDLRPALAPMALEPMALAPMALSVDMAARSTPPQAWAPADSADSLYRVARDVLNRGDYGRAARMFAELQKTYPRSVYVGDAQYWEAWARYRIGTTDELRAAAKLLEPLASRVTPADSREQNALYYAGRRASEGRRTSDNDILALYARVNGVLAQRGDREAAAKVEKAAATSGAPCDREDLQVRAEALNALSQMDPGAALPILQRVIDRRDDCSSSLRRSAVFMLGRRSDSQSSALLLNVAKNDPDVSVRSEALTVLARVPGDASVAALEDILRTEKDERVQRAAVRALGSSDSPRARAAVRTLIDRGDAPLALRAEAITSLGSEHATSEDVAYLRGLFGKVDSDRLKSAIMSAVARADAGGSAPWLLSVVRNNNEASVVRADALARVARSNAVTTSDLAKLYDESAESFEIRRRVVSILGARRDSAATDKLIDIVKNGTVVSLRTQAINALANKKDPRATQLLTDILSGKQP